MTIKDHAEEKARKTSPEHDRLLKKRKRSKSRGARKSDVKAKMLKTAKKTKPTEAEFWKPNAKQIKEATSALLLLHSKLGTSKKDLFSDEGEFVHLQISSVHLPPRGNQMRTITIPFRFIPSTARICLFVKDKDKNKRNDHEETIHETKMMLSDAGVQYDVEVMTLQQVRTECKPFEVRGKLANSFDMFLSEISILKFLPRALGKHFVKNKSKMPIAIDVNPEQIKSQFEKVLDSTRLTMNNKGASATLRVGITNQPEEEIAANVEAVLNQLETTYPGGWSNVRKIDLKTSKSPAVPLYLNILYPSELKEVNFPKKKRKIIPATGELSTVGGSKEKTVSVYPDGRIKFVKGPRKESEADSDEKKNLDEESGAEVAVEKVEQTQTGNDSRSKVSRSSRKRIVKNKKTVERVVKSKETKKKRQIKKKSS